MGLFAKQRSSETCIGSATPTQHLYHSKQNSNSIKGATIVTGPIANNVANQELSLKQQSIADYYYSSSGLSAQLHALQQNTAIRG